jgi:hypothetical protein
VGARSSIDRVLAAVLVRKWSRERTDRYFDALTTLESADVTLARAAFADIDTKAGALLMHVSMMIAALGVCAPTIATNVVEEAVIFAEIAAYLLIATADLRCIASLAPSEEANEGEGLAAWLRRELVFRQELYALCNRSTIFLTLVVFVSLPVLLAWSPNPVRLGLLASTFTVPI